MLKFITKLFGSSKSEKDVQKIRPILEKANSFFASYASLTNDELRGKTTEFKQRVQNYLTAIDAQIAEKKEIADALSDTEIHKRDAIYKEVDTLNKERDQKIEEVLAEIQPEAFAVVKETARRFSTN